MDPADWPPVNRRKDRNVKDSRRDSPDGVKNQKLELPKIESPNQSPVSSRGQSPIGSVRSWTSGLSVAYSPVSDYWNEESSEDRPVPKSFSRPVLFRNGLTMSPASSPEPENRLPQLPPRNMTSMIEPVQVHHHEEDDEEERMKNPPSRAMSRFTFTNYDIETDDDPEAPPPRNKEDPVGMYTAACRTMGLVPMSRVARRLKYKYLSAKSMNMSGEDAKALAVALVKNRNVEWINLEDNDIRSMGAISLADLCSGNEFISDLNLSYNNIGSDGVRVLCATVTASKTIKKLDLSGNHMDEHDAAYVAHMIEENASLTRLALSHNDFNEAGGVLLAGAISNNDRIESLDLSWNHIRGKGAVAIGASLQHNCAIKYLDLSWNGFFRAGGNAIGNSLRENRSLVWLDLSCNRLIPESLKNIIQGCLKNDKLMSMKVCMNAISPEMARIILQLLDGMGPDCALRELDLGDTVVDDTFLENMRRIYETKNVTVKHGTTVGKSKQLVQFVERIYQDMNPVRELYLFMNKEGLRVKELFDRLDLNKDSLLTRDEFIVGMTRIGLKPTRKHVDDLFDALDANKDGFVDLLELMEIRQKQFTMKRPPHAPVKRTNSRMIKKTSTALNPNVAGNSLKPPEAIR